MRVAVLALALCLCVPLPALSRKGRALEQEAPTPDYTYTIPIGVELEKLPGASLLLGLDKKTAAADISLVPVAVKGVPKNKEDAKPATVAIGAMMYLTAGQPSPLPFGPTLRVKRGQTMTHKVTNRMMEFKRNDKLAQAATYTQELIKANFTNMHNALTHTMETNVHTHGIHGSPGLLAQPSVKPGEMVRLGPKDYSGGGDNVFISVPPLNNAANETNTLTLRNSVHGDHLPGTHWYHPHRHGASALQAAHASGVWIVEDDPLWLPDKNGCGPLRRLLASAKERVLHLSMFTLGQPNGLNPMWGQFDIPSLVETIKNIDKLDLLAQFAALDDLFWHLESPNEQMLALGSDPGFPQFEAGDNVTQSKGLADVLLLNGGYRPVIKVTPGVWQRWRIINTSVRYILQLAVLTSPKENVGKPAPCEIMVVGKDGVYMMQIPRKVATMYPSSGGRAEILFRCSGPPNKEYYLTAGIWDPANPLKIVDFDGSTTPYKQGYVAKIVVGATNKAAADAQAALGALKPEACTPLRPSYAADLRDAALKAAKVPSSAIVRRDVALNDVLNFACDLNGMLFKFPTPTPVVFPVGKVVEISVTFTNSHALHMHVHPFQIVKLFNDSLGPGATYTDYYREGDWHDVLSLQMLNSGAPVTVRVAPGPFGGYGLVHCHILPHEDVGCMSLLKFECPGVPGNAQPYMCPGFKAPVPGTASAVDLKLRL